jgi:hypothetical protein
MNKYNLLATLAVFGVLAVIFAAWAKITHQPYSQTAMTIGFYLAGIAIASLVWVLFMWAKKKAS